MTNREKLLAEVEQLRNLLLDDEGFGMASWHVMYQAALERVAEWSPNHVKNSAATTDQSQGPTEQEIKEAFRQRN